MALFQGWKRPEDSDLICGKEAFHKSILWFYDKKQNLFKAILPGSILNIKKVLLPAIPIDGESVVSLRSLLITVMTSSKWTSLQQLEAATR